MTFTETFPQRIAFRCDASPSIGVGHVVRCVALGEELRARGFEVVLWGSVEGIGWLSELVDSVGFSTLPAAEGVTEQVRTAAEAGFGGIVLDGYHLLLARRCATCCRARRARPGRW
ncbi:hypothetical protein [Flexivirga alba]|uniref:UDP-2,4-diacetamido-2,4, 6-trideoxy-beta-L-altropyranose hydrolase n=1 Tax=Flexivirga alba TaxID=702742 RepID=A0ABW2AMA7_9MICO